MKLNLIAAGLVLVFACNRPAEKDVKYGYDYGSDATPVPPPSPDAVKAEAAFETMEGDANSTDLKFTPPQLQRQDVPVVNGVKKIIRDGHINVSCDDLAASKLKTDGWLKELNGYYESEVTSNTTEAITAQLVLRVPASKFDRLIGLLETGGDKITYRNLTARDVTEDYTDTETRLATRRDYLRRYRELLARAGSIKDILALQENVRALQEEIESSEGHLRFLSDKVTYSTLNLTLTQAKPFVYQPVAAAPFAERVKNALHDGWKSVVEFCLGLLTAWPFILVLVVMVVVVRRFVHRRKKNRLPAAA